MRLVRLFMFSSLVVLMAHGADAATIGINIAGGNDEASGGLLPTTSAGYTGFAQTNWNNYNAGGFLSSPVTDSTGATVTGLSVVHTGGALMPTDIQSNGPGALPGELAYIGYQGGNNVWDDEFYGPVSMTISNIPYASYNVAVLMAERFSTLPVWYLVEGATSGTQTFSFGQGSISGSTFSWSSIEDGQARRSDYAYQVIDTSAVPEPAAYALAGMAAVFVTWRLRGAARQRKTASDRTGG